MKRVWIAGSSGSGKTTLANILSDKLDIPVYHRDYISWRDDFSMRAEDEQIALTRSITAKDKWIFEGARFTASKIDGRLEKCDTVIHLEINRFVCAYRVYKRARQKANRTDLTEVDKQPFSFDLLRYILWDYPNKNEQRKTIFMLAKEKGITVIILKSKKAVNTFIERLT